jgi:hypothetical protein
LGSSQKATIIDIGLILAKHDDALKSGNLSTFRRYWQVQEKEQALIFALLPQ